MKLKERARQRQADTGGHDGHIHIVRDDDSNWDAPLTVAVALCGASCVITEDGKTTPAGFDFYAMDGNWRRDPDMCRQCVALADR